MKSEAVGLLRVGSTLAVTALGVEARSSPSLEEASTVDAFDMIGSELEADRSVKLASFDFTCARGLPVWSGKLRPESESGWEALRIGKVADVVASGGLADELADGKYEDGVLFPMSNPGMLVDSERPRDEKKAVVGVNGVDAWLGLEV